MRQARLAERSAPHSPAPRAAGKRKFHGARGVAFERGAEAQLGGGKPQQTLDGTREQSFACAIHEAKFVFIVEGKNRHIDFFHHRAQERAGFQRAEPLLAQRLA